MSRGFCFRGTGLDDHVMEQLEHGDEGVIRKFATYFHKKQFDLPKISPLCASTQLIVTDIAATANQTKEYQKTSRAQK